MDVDTRKYTLCDRVEGEIHFVNECQLCTETGNKFFSVVIVPKQCLETYFLLKMNS